MMAEMGVAIHRLWQRGVHNVPPPLPAEPIQEDVRPEEIIYLIKSVRTHLIATKKTEKKK